MQIDPMRSFVTRLLRVFAICGIVTTTLTACQLPNQNGTSADTDSADRSQFGGNASVTPPRITVVVLKPTVAPTETPIPTPTPPPVRTIWVDPALPESLRNSLFEQITTVSQQQSAGTAQVQVGTDPNADIVIDANGNAAGLTVITRTYAVAAPFPTVADSITLSALTAFWQGNATALTTLTNDGSAPTLFMDADTRAAVALLLGEPGAGAPIQVVNAGDLVATTWAARPGSFAILPFDQLEARWKLIWVDGMNLFDKQSDTSQYPLTLRIRAQARSPEDMALIGQFPTSTNYDVNKMAVVAMTGVTALVRGTAVQMENKGITYPAEKIRDWLVTADVTHISNEVSFWDNCPSPTFNDGTSMCSNPKYIELLEYVGTDIVELSGNHLWDKGPMLLSSTISMYDERGWPYFAGGRTYTESQRAVTMTVAGNRLAFVGCNWFGADWATPQNELPGSALCGSNNPHELDLIVPTIQALAAEGYLVIATMQYAEFYFYQPTPQQERDFKTLREAGAVVVNGSQGHHVQGFDVSATGFIHYGTGNLFFGDQFERGAHQTFVDRHIFYDGKYLGADLRSAFIEDYSQPVPMTPEDRAQLLKALFEATGY